MINDLATHRLDPDRGLPDTGDLRADLTAWAQELISHYSKPVNASLLRGGAAAAGEGESDCLRDRRARAAAFAAWPGSTFAPGSRRAALEWLPARSAPPTVLCGWKRSATRARALAALVELSEPSHACRFAAQVMALDGWATVLPVLERIVPRSVAVVVDQMTS